MEELFMEDNYLKEFRAKIESVKENRFIILDKTAFYPVSGGQPYDTGIIEINKKRYNVVYVGRFSKTISHEIENKDNDEIKPGTEITAKINWERRYKLMRMHTAAHILSRVIHSYTKATTSGNQLGTEKSRIDFKLESFNKEEIKGWFEEANKIIKSGLKVEKRLMKREEAFKLKGFAEVSPHLLKSFDILRVVLIEGFDAQPCGGTHVDNTSEIKGIEFLKAENKGKNNRRIYFQLKES